MSLPKIFTELYAEAAAREAPGHHGEAVKQLGRGARVAVRVRGRRRQVLLGRAGVFVSEDEVTTFRRDGRVPETAERTDYTTAGNWFTVALTWEEPPGLFDEEEEDG